MCRADTIKKETWQTMKDAGCFGVKLGFESGNQQVVDQIVNKRLDLDAAADVVRHLKGIGMTVHGTFTYGLPGETAEQMQDTKNFIASLPFDSFQESGTAEIEGTPLATLRREGHLAAYAGATIDAGYEVEADGAKKFRELAEKLKAS
jgi:radical SAM superfamily enzyme